MDNRIHLMDLPMHLSLVLIAWLSTACVICSLVVDSAETDQQVEGPYFQYLDSMYDPNCIRLFEYTYKSWSSVAHKRTEGHLKGTYSCLDVRSLIYTCCCLQGVY